MSNVLPPTSLSLTSSAAIRDNRTHMSKEHQSLEKSLSSAGHCEYLYEGTQNLRSALSANRRLIENQVHEVNSKNLSNRAQSEIEFVELCINISKDLGTKLSAMKTDSGNVDQTFHTWCTQKLTEIARIANKTTFDGEYALSAQHPTVEPVNRDIITLPLPITGIADLSYAVGGYDEMVHQLNAREQTSLGVSIIHPGIENLVRTLRECLNGNVMNSKDVVWDATVDLLNGSAVPQLSYALKEAGELKKQADDSIDVLKTENIRMGEVFKDHIFRPMEQLLNQKIEAKGLVDLQESLFTANQISTQNFNNKIDQLF